MKGHNIPVPTDPRSRVVPETGLFASSTFTYVQVLLPIFRFCICKKDHITYSGEVDSKGRPHGYGRWSDSHWHGETLEGWWQQGIPMAPFKARETGSNSSFKAVRMGYIRCRADELSSLLLMPRSAPIKIGIASAECSVSGLFFRDYPVIRFLTGVKTNRVTASKDAQPVCNICNSLLTCFHA